MGMSVAEIRAGLRDGTVVFCLPAAHENFTRVFLDGFSERILKRDWRDVAHCGHLQISALVDDDESMEEMVANIRDEYGTEIADLPELPLWEVLRRCARCAK
jgi:hypothetical protein